MDSEDKSISKYTLECIMLYQYKIVRGLIIALIVMSVVILATIVSCVWYMSLPVEGYEETITQEQDGEANTMIGIDNHGIETDNN